ncbi:MAG: hypothetical protein HUJ51_00800 [Eggerthellaceae bacterium]|nr:hypothetical protein [Eggerthellaceae bacterium]
MMYCSLSADCAEYCEKDGYKTFIICKYIHNMANSLVGLSSYYEMIDKYPIL